MKRFILILSSVVVIVMMAATFVEKYYGTEIAKAWIYSSQWFCALWALLTIAGLAYIVRRKLYKRPEVFLLHVAFVLILIGALVTHLTQVKGMMHLRAGFPTAEMVEEDGRMRQLNFTLELDTFYITYEDGTQKHKDYTSIVNVKHKTAKPDDGNMARISMNKILKVGNVRFYQADYDPDMRGSYLIVNRDPWGISITYIGYILMGVSFIILFCRRGYRKWCMGALLLAGFIAFLFSRKEYDMPVLNTWLLPVHVSLIIASYVMLFMAVWFRRLLTISLGMLSMGIFIGAYWANISWGTYWSWDPKEVWALITLMVYALPAHSTSFPRFRDDRFYKSYMLISFICVLMTYLGVNYLLGGMHSYGA